MVRGKQQAGILAVSALVAAVIVIAGAMAYLSRGLPRDPAEALRFAGPDLNFVMGSGSMEGSRWLIRGFDNGYALLSSGPVIVQADAYRFLSLDIDAPAGTVTLFWRQSETPGNLNQWPVREAGRSVIDLGSARNWQGEVSEIGLLVQETQAGRPGIGPVALEPDSLALRLRLTWESWTAFERWTQKSVNFLQGGRRDQPLRLPVLLMAWIGLALLFIWIGARFFGRGSPSQVLAGGLMLFMAAWMALDLRWTANSLQQSQRTRAAYGDATEEERLSRGLDGEIYRDLAAIKTGLLPDRPARILILGEEQAVEYILKRAAYHLLPHSARATRTIPAGLEPGTVNFVIFFGQPNGVARVPGWSQDWQNALTIKRVYDWGALFEVTSEERRQP